MVQHNEMEIQLSKFVNVWNVQIFSDIDFSFSELARDALHRTGRFRVIGGIISPVSDSYTKKASNHLSYFVFV